MKLISILAIFFFTMTCKTFSQKHFVDREEILMLSNEDSILLVDTWKSFLKRIDEKDYAAIKEGSLEKVYCKSFGHVLPGLFKDKLMPIDLFVDSVVSKFYDGHFINVLNDSTFRVSKSAYPDRKPSNFTPVKGQRLIIFDIYFIDLVPMGEAKDRNYYIFRFIKKDGKFKFFELRLESPH